MTTLRVGIVGAGGIAAKMHLPEMQTVPEARVTLIAGRRQSRLDVLRRKFDVPASTLNYEAVVAEPEIDAVIIALPHPLHVEWGVKALQAGKHVYMQKPLSTSLDEADRFVEAVDRSDRTVLALPYSSNPTILAIREQITEGKLGTVSAGHARYSHGGPEVYYAGIQQILEEEPDDNLWFFDADKADVGALFDMGVYAIANLVAVMGSVTSVTARCVTVDKPTRLEDTAAMILDFASGAIGTAETGWCDAARSAYLSIHGTQGKVATLGRNEPLQWWRPGSTTDEDAPPIVEAVDLSPFPDQNSHQNWVDCIRRGVQPELSNVRMARHITEIMLAGLESSKQRKSVEIASCCD